MLERPNEILVGPDLDQSPAAVITQEMLASADADWHSLLSVITLSHLHLSQITLLPKKGILCSRSRV